MNMTFAEDDRPAYGTKKMNAKAEKQIQEFLDDGGIVWIDELGEDLYETLKEFAINVQLRAAYERYDRMFPPKPSVIEVLHVPTTT